MIKVNFDFEGTGVVAYAENTGSSGLSRMVLKFVNDEGDRIYPRFTTEQRDEIEELAMEYLQDAEHESELRF